MRPLLPAFIILLAVTTTPASAFAQEATRPARRDPQPQVRYPLGPDSLPQDGVPKGTLEGPFLFRSDIIANTVRRYWVYVPAQYRPNDAACVLVFQDGARAINPEGVLRVPQVLENLIARKQIPVTIGIFVTPGQRGDEFPDSIGTGNPDNRDREYDVLTDDYARMLIDELLPEVGKKYNLTKDPAGRAIGGASSGGICAFTVAWERPDQFRNVISLIGSFTNIHGGHVYPDLVMEADRKAIRIFLQDGVNDLRNPGDPNRDWHIQNQKMVAALKEQSYDMAHVFGEGGHSDDHGGAMLPQMLRWIWRDYPGVEPSAADPVAEAAAIRPETTELFPGFDPAASVDPTGEYTWTARRGNNAVVTTISLQRTGGQLSGTYTSQRGDDPPETSDLIDPVMEGNKLTFDAKSSFRNRDFVSTYQGIVTPSGIAGWRMMDFGGQARDSSWTAERVSTFGLLKPTSNPDSWQFELTENGQGSMEADGDAIVFHTTALSEENWHVQAYQAGIDLKDGATYELTFSAKSPDNSAVLAMGIINEADWHGIGLNQEENLTREFREYSITFTASDVVEKNNRIGFVLGLAKGTVFVRNMSLTEKRR
ncbi:MAG: alpha/beta hydrolase-fold protein [Planctomycetaceae bacterium]